MIGWQVKIQGRDLDYLSSITADGEVAYTDIPTESWTTLDIIGASPIYSEDGEAIMTAGGLQYKRPLLRRNLKLHLVPIKFPDGMDIIETLADITKKKCVFLYNVDYPVAFHTADYAAWVNIGTVVEDDYDNGEKRITIEINKVYPK